MFCLSQVWIGFNYCNLTDKIKTQLGVKMSFLEKPIYCLINGFSVIKSRTEVCVLVQAKSSGALNEG
jgi:hypothetical protein